MNRPKMIFQPRSSSMKKMTFQFAFGLAALGVALGALAQTPVIYPAKGQSPQQQASDDVACMAWAKQTTGIDPITAAQTPPPAPSGPATGGGERVSGAARGALGGLAIGAIAGDAGKGAAIGAASGGLIGGMRQRDQAAQQQAVQQNQAANYDQQRSNFNRAYQGCLEGRGYSVK